MDEPKEETKDFSLPPAAQAPQDEELAPQSNGQSPTPNSFVMLGDELLKRTRTPVTHVSFWAFFLIGVLALSGLGIWVEVAALVGTAADLEDSKYASLRTAFITFFPVLIGTSCMQLIWSEESEKYMKSFSVLLIVLTFGAAIISAKKTVPDFYAFFIAGSASLVALWVWWIANAYQSDLLDFAPFDASVGGNPRKESLQGAAALDRLKH